MYLYIPNAKFDWAQILGTSDQLTTALLLKNSINPCPHGIKTGGDYCE